MFPNNVRRVSAGIVALSGILLAVNQLAAQTFDFESGLDGWINSGRAFDAQPTKADAVRTDRIAPVTVGGDYWRGLTYPLGQNGTSLIATAVVYGDGASGTLTS